MPMPYSDEQQRIIDAVNDPDVGLVTVNAVPGSGKTHTAIGAARRFACETGKRVLILTYNRLLRNDTVCKVKEDSMTAQFIVTHNFHSAAIAFYDQQEKHAGNDGSFLTIANDTARPKNDALLQQFGLVIVDEAQDVNATRSDLVCRLLKRITAGANSVRMLVVGDVLQRIYGHQGCVADYLLRPQDFWGDYLDDNKIAVNLRLSYSFRITHDMADLINNHVNVRLLKETHPRWYSQNGAAYEDVWGNGIRAAHADCNHRSPSVQRVYYDNVHACARNITPVILAMVARFGISNVGVFAHSIKATTPEFKNIQKLATEPTNLPLHFCVDESDISSREDDVRLARNCLLVSTIHKQKGRTVKCAVVFLSSFIEELVGHNGDPTDIFNTYYVGVSRATDMLVLVQPRDKRQQYATFRKFAIPYVNTSRPKTASSITSLAEICHLVPEMQHFAECNDVIKAPGAADGALSDGGALTVADTYVACCAEGKAPVQRQFHSEMGMALHMRVQNCKMCELAKATLGLLYAQTDKKKISSKQSRQLSRINAEIARLAQLGDGANDLPWEELIKWNILKQILNGRIYKLTQFYPWDHTFSLKASATAKLDDAQQRSVAFLASLQPDADKWLFEQRLLYATANGAIAVDGFADVVMLDSALGPCIVELKTGGLTLVHYYQLLLYMTLATGRYDKPFSGVLYQCTTGKYHVLRFDACFQARVAIEAVLQRAHAGVCLKRGADPPSNAPGVDEESKRTRA